jgi:chondroitin AC lyase
LATISVLALQALLALLPARAEEVRVLFPNPGFEEGAKEWTLPAGTQTQLASVSAEQAASGTKSLKIIDADAKDGSNVNGPLVPVPSAGLYELRGKVFPVSGSGLGIYLRLLDEKGKPLPGDPHLLGLGGDDHRWQPFSASLLVPPQAKHVQVWIHSYTASVVTAYLDDFEVVLTKGREDGVDRETDMETIKQRLHEMALGGGGAFQDVPGFVKDQQPEGSWGDIDYANTNATAWAPANHVNRAYRMAQAYAQPESPQQGKPELKQAILRAFDFWTRERPKCPNWWYNVIGVPRTMYRLMLLIEGELSKEQREAGLAVLEEAKLGMTGQNLVWVAEVTIARGCLAKEAWLVQVAFDSLAKEIRVTTGEGVQPDCSFHQHGDQLYSGGYGRGFSQDCPHFAVLARGTCFQFPQEKVDILSSYLLDGQQWMARGSTFDYSACGREISRKGAGSAKGLIGACRDLAQLDSPRKAEFEAFAARLEKPTPRNALVGNKHFWRVDYMAHHRPESMASVRMTSPRTLQTETCNDESLLGRHLSDGLLYLYQTGDEYTGIFPVWDWKRLPGITCELTDDPPVTKNGQRGQRAFVGGVSNGQYGLAAMDFARGKLTAKKAWFFFDNEIVCLGAGLNCPTDFPVITSINQCLLKGDVLVSAGGPAQVAKRGKETLNGPAWVHHDGVGYLFPERNQLVLKDEPQTGNWWQINHVYPKDEVSEDVFSLWINHGKQVANGGYQYSVLPGIAPDALAAYSRKPPIEVLQNTPDIQAVRQHDAKIVAVAFYQPGKLTVPDGPSLAADQPCLLLMRQTDKGVEIAVSNPENKPLEVVVEAGAKLSGEGCTWSEREGVSRIRFQLPDGGQAGESVVRTFTVVAP